MRLLLEELKGVVHDEFPKRSPLMRDIQHHISKASLPNRSHDQMNSTLPDEFQGEKF